MDSLSAEHRSWNMSRIRGSDTTPERVVRSLLHRMGHRYRLHQKNLPARPDIVMAGRRTVILVHGCYWHRHPGCRFAYTPKTNRDFWEAKFQENVARDTRQRGQLHELGWTVITVWECETKNPATLAERLQTSIPSRLPP
ncbi:MAG: DNA mismatch endonuclease Vsr [Chloroflexota bacterium]|nr:DNA mismatch endonuclease Vsr [Chloroflexota bacterium]